MRTNLPDLSLEALTHLSPKASTPEALQAVMQLPVHLRIVGLRIVAFLGGVLLSRDDDLREMALASLGASIESYGLLRDVLTPGREASGLRQHEAVSRVLAEVMPGQEAALSSMERYLDLVTGHLATLRAGDRPGPDAFDDVLRVAYRDFHPHMAALSGRMAEVGRGFLRARDDRAVRARDRAMAARERIDEISRTVRLISLNARVEAARAGVAGRAFGVIAQEIKILSEHAEEAGGELASGVEDMMANLRTV